jgi:beta-lactamase superfamily II metal-dependent hydrolase
MRLSGFMTGGILLLGLLGFTPGHAGVAPTLRLFWVDVEGGAATLLVTPAGESVLFDAGNPGERDARRIHRVATEAAGLARIDHLLVTHFHRDHFGGMADLVRFMPVGSLYERDPASAPEAERAQPELEPYRTASVAQRIRIAPGDRLPLQQAAGSPPVSLRVLGAGMRFAKDEKARPNAACVSLPPKPADESDNRNSVVTRVSFGGFEFFDGGDLTWAAEEALACPEDGTGGRVDVAQVNHHGLDTSNHPALFRTLRPAVVIVNNGPGKGNEPGTFALLQALPGPPTVYQLHRNLRSPESNVAAERIANEAEDCGAHFVRLTVDAQARSYEVWVPSTGHRRSYRVR